MNRYTFNVLCTEVWTVVTEAPNEDTAWQKIKDRDYFKIYAFEGTTPSGKTELVNVQPIGGTENE